MKPKKIALIGCGRIGFILENDRLRYKPCTHFGGATSANLKINYACDINRERLKEFARIGNLSKNNLFIDYKELLLNERPDLVIIASWTETHADIGILAARNGARTIICEKPISSNLLHAGRFIDECNKNNVSLIINHERRYDSRYRLVKKLLNDGRIGEVKTVKASILSSGYNGSSSIKEGGGPLLHDGTHMIDMIRFLFGEITSVRGGIQRKGRSSGYEDRAIAWIKTENGIDVFIEAGGSRKYFVFELDISGTEGKIVIGNGYERIFGNKKSRLYSGFRDLYEKPFPRVNGINYFKREYLEAKKVLSGYKKDVTSSGSDGYKALEAIHAIYLSSFIDEEIELPLNPSRIDLKEIFNLGVIR